jgi:hypothetical protein
MDCVVDNFGRLMALIFFSTAVTRPVAGRGKPMKRLILALSAPCILCLASCNYVACRSPVGTPLTEGVAEKFDGAWQEGNHVGYMKALGEGKVRFYGIKDDEKGVALNEETLVVTTIGEEQYLNWPIRLNGPAQPPLYIPFRMAANSQMLVLYPPKYEPFADAVRSAKLKGEIKEEAKPVPRPATVRDGKTPPEKEETTRTDNREAKARKSNEPSGVTIDDDAALAEFIRQRPTSELFDMDRPFISTRIGEPRKKTEKKECSASDQVRQSAG